MAEQHVGVQPPKPHTNGLSDVKPRLTKEQHDILERHFLEHHKPSTNTKKGFADNLGVPIDKINNWFQNRRAKVKQDLKKAMNQYSMYPPPPIPTSQYSALGDNPVSSQPLMDSHYYPINTENPPPVMHNNDIQSAHDLAPHMSMNVPFDMRSLRSIPEADRAANYNSNFVMQSIMAATAGAAYMPNQQPQMPQQGPDLTYGDGFVGSMDYLPPHGLPMDTTNFDNFQGIPDFDPSALADAHASASADVHRSTGSISSHNSPMTAQSSAPGKSSVTSITSLYSGWQDENKDGSTLQQPQDQDENYESLLSSWGQDVTNQAFSQAGMFQHLNASSQALMASPSPGPDHKLSLSLGDLEPPPSFGEDVYSRRNSSTTNLASNMEAINIQNSQSPDSATQPYHSSSLAIRRQKRPVVLNSGAIRSESYSAGGMPSPGGANQDHTLRRIRSSGIGNGGGRVQKSGTNSAQRSPMTMTFADAAASPKFARAMSSSSITTLGQGASLAPPTPQTPNETNNNNILNWQGKVLHRHNMSIPERSSPDSLNAHYSMGSQSPGPLPNNNTTSPPSPPSDMRNWNHGQVAADDLYRDTPPQSAPATQQGFPRSIYMHPPQARAAFHSTSDLTIAESKPSHDRRPSLPNGGNVNLDYTQMQYPSYLDDMYSSGFGDMPLDGIHNVPFAPPPSIMPELTVQEFLPPPQGGPGSLFRRTTEPPPKTFIFANAGPGDFKQ